MNITALTRMFIFKQMNWIISFCQDRVPHADYRHKYKTYSFFLIIVVWIIDAHLHISYNTCFPHLIKSECTFQFNFKANDYIGRDLQII